MKKLIPLLLVVPFLFGCKEKKYTGPKITVERNETGELVDATPETMFSVAHENKTDSVFYIGDETCAACKQLKPQLEAWVKAYNGTIYYIKFNTITSENMQNLYDATEGYYKWSESTPVPVTYFFMQGEVIVQGDSTNTMKFLNKYVTVAE